MVEAGIAELDGDDVCVDVTRPGPVTGCPAPAEGTRPGDCTDDADNDGDGLFDCNDEGCAGAAACAGAGDTETGDGGAETGGDTGGDDDSSSDDDLAYCSGTPAALVDVVRCDPSYNIDPWASAPSLRRVEVPALKILSIPFTTTDSTTAYGHVQAYSTSDTHAFTASDPHRWHAWYSAVPGGDSLGPGCDWYALEPYDLKLQWEKTAADEYACVLGPSSAVRYINFEARCFPEQFSSNCTDPEDRWNGVYVFNSTTRRNSD